MKRFLKLAGLTLPFAIVLIFASWGFVRAQGQRYYADSVVADTFIDIKGSAAPSLSSAGQCRMYFDSTANAWKASQNGGAFGVVTSGSTLGRNKLINGNFTIWQRGTASSVPSINTYIADRWYASIFNIASDRYTFTQQANSATNSPQTSPAPFTVKCICSTASAPNATERFLFTQAIEMRNWFDLIGKPIVLSFWVRAHVAQTYYYRIYNNFNGDLYLGSYTVISPDTWEYKTSTFTDTDTGSTVAPTESQLSSVSYEVSFTIDCGSSNIDNTKVGTWVTGGSQVCAGTVATHISASTSNDIWFSQVQLEPGSVATSFEGRSYQQELALCQRYCYVLTGKASTYQFVGGLDSTSQGEFIVQYPVTMRTSPTLTAVTSTALGHLTLQNSAATQTSTVTAISLNSTTPFQGLLLFTGTGTPYTANNSCSVTWSASGATTDILDFEADY